MNGLNTEEAMGPRQAADKMSSIRKTGGTVLLRTVPLAGGTMARSSTFWLTALVALLWGIILFPPEAHSRPQSSPEGSIVIEDPYLAVAQADPGYVDIQSDEVGDRFVDEDGDGLDDRHLRRHQNRNRQRWREDDSRGSGSENDNKGFSGQQGHGSGPGWGGR